MMRITNIQLCGNENRRLKRDTIYADLVNDDGSLVISATLDYVLAAIRDRDYEVEGITVEPVTNSSFGSKVILDKYESR